MKHYVGLTFADGDNKGGLAIRWDKNDRALWRDWGEFQAESSELGHNDGEELS